MKKGRNGIAIYTLHPRMNDTEREYEIESGAKA